MKAPNQARARARVEKRRRMRIRQRRQIPEVKEAIDKILRGAEEAHEKGWAFETPSRDTGLHHVEPFWLETLTCRRHGLSVTVRKQADGAPLVNISMTAATEQEGAAARLQYPQDLLSPAEYDIWEIRRGAPLSEIFDEIAVQIWEMEEDRRTLGFPKRPRRRGRSTDRALRAIKAYAALANGEELASVAAIVNRHPRTVQKMVREFCRGAGLAAPGRSEGGGGETLQPGCFTECRFPHCPSQPERTEYCASCPYSAVMAEEESKRREALLESIDPVHPTDLARARQRKGPLPTE